MAVPTCASARLPLLMKPKVYCIYGMSRIKARFKYEKIKAVADSKSEQTYTISL